MRGPATRDQPKQRGPENIKGSERNQPCACGSGRKAKVCVPTHIPPARPIQLIKNPEYPRLICSNRMVISNRIPSSAVIAAALAIR
jgi:hypothetical protein